MLRPVPPSHTGQVRLGDVAGDLPASAPPQRKASKPLPTLPGRYYKDTIYLDAPSSPMEARSAPADSRSRDNESEAGMINEDDEEAYGGVMSIYGGVAPSTIYSFEALDREYHDAPEMPTSVSVDSCLDSLADLRDQIALQQEHAASGDTSSLHTLRTAASSPRTLTSVAGQCGFDGTLDDRTSPTPTIIPSFDGQRISLSSASELPSSESMASIATVRQSITHGPDEESAGLKRVSSVSLAYASPRKASLPPHLRTSSLEHIRTDPIATPVPSAVLQSSAFPPQPQVTTPKEEQALPPLPPFDIDAAPTLALPRISTFHIDDSWSDGLLSAEEKAQRRLAKESSLEPMPARA